MAHLSEPSEDKSGSRRFAGIYQATAKRMQADLERLRAGLDHAGTKGSAAEEIVRDFLKEALPRSLGITVGQVIDADGNLSGQSDVIIYDALATPMIFSSAQAGQRTVPIEGVVGVIEVKSKLRKGDLEQIVSHAATLKAMERRAFMPEGFSVHREMYGQTWDVLPVLYSVFAFESDGLYAHELNQLQADTPLHLRLDNLCVLDRGLLVNIGLTGHVSDPSSLFTIGPTAVPISKLGEATPSNPLMPWFAMNASLYVQSRRPPINLAVYVQDELQFDVVESRDYDHQFRGELLQQMADETGIPRDLLQAMLEGKSYNMAPQDWRQIVEPYRKGQLRVPDDDHEVKARLDFLAALPPAELEEILNRIEGQHEAPTDAT